MTHQKPNPGTQAGGLRSVANRLLVVALLALLLPRLTVRVLGMTGHAGVLGAVTNLGWLLLAVAGLLYWAGRRRAGPSQPLGPDRPSTHPSGASRFSTQPPASRFAPSTLLPATDAGPETASPPPGMWSTTVFQVIEWRRFEAVLEAYFAQAGFITNAKSRGPDGGVDIWLYSRHQPGDPVGFVHGRHWLGKKVGTEMLRDFLRETAEQRLPRAQYATASMFTPDAIEFAHHKHVRLLDPKALVALIEQRTPEEQKALLNVALEGEYWRPTCPKCGIKLVERDDAKDGKRYWGCANDPICKTTMVRRTLHRRGA